jgi:hypothetical protein
VFSVSTSEQELVNCLQLSNWTTPTKDKSQGEDRDDLKKVTISLIVYEVLKSLYLPFSFSLMYAKRDNVCSVFPSPILWTDEQQWNSFRKSLLVTQNAVHAVVMHPCQKWQTRQLIVLHLSVSYETRLLLQFASRSVHAQKRFLKGQIVEKLRFGRKERFKSLAML